ncbi:hypothetical protein ACFO6V_28265 [Promicromonospora alba]|uniref:Uncharacterized protein n=1 Tax=Promicromonospora alba TaxID=1616110 RepID=A0ABV9HRY1_9MICO
MSDHPDTAPPSEAMPRQPSDLAELREAMVERLGLLRKYKGALHLTRAGATARDEPAVLFDHRTGATPPQERRRFVIDADLLVLAYAAVTPAGELPLDRIAAHLTDLRYQHDDGRPAARHVLHQYEARPTSRHPRQHCRTANGTSSAESDQRGLGGAT